MRFPEHVAGIRKMVDAHMYKVLVEELYGKRRKFWRIILKWKICGGGIDSISFKKAISDIFGEQVNDHQIS